VRRIVLAATLAALALPSLAHGEVRITSVRADDASKVHVTAVTGTPTKRPPALRENGQPVAGLSAENLGSGKSVVLAIDRSQSMRGQALLDASAAARAFVGAKAPADRIAIVAVGHRALQLSRFTSATIDADTTLRSVDTDATRGTALYDAVVLSAKALADEPYSGRVLILLTDGQEVSSEASLAAAIDAAKDARVTVHPIGIESSAFRPLPLRRLAAETGGRYHAAASTGELRSIYAAIASELRRTWQIEYLTNATAGQTRTVSVAAPGHGTASSTFTAVAGTAGSGPGGLLPKSFFLSTAGTFLISLFVAALVLLAGAIAIVGSRGSWLRRRVDPHVQSVAVKNPRHEERERLAAAAELFRITERSFGHTRGWKNVQRKLERAAMPLKTVELIYICIGAGFLLALVTAVLALPSLLIVVALAAGASLPYLFVHMKGKRRANAFEEQLPDILLTMAASLKAGHSFKQGLGNVVEEGRPPASEEFKRVLTEMQLGRPMDEALKDAAERTGSTNFEFVITAVTIQRQVGGSLAGLFDMVADTVRGRQQFARKVKGLTAMGRASAYVLVGLPFFLAAALTVINSEYMSPLFTESTGHMLIGIALVMMTIGSAILRKIVSFKV
jgi:tight adherence protein B